MSLLATASPVLGQDLVVMRRVISPASITNAPSKQVGQWKENDWRWAADAPTCSLAAPMVRTPTCVAGGIVVPDARCAAARPSTTMNMERLQGCTTLWTEGGFGDYSPSCSAKAVKSQTVQCQRFGDGMPRAVVDDALCSARPKPASRTEPAIWYGGCGYDWSTTRAQCSADGRRAVTAVCVRSGGDTSPTPVPDGECAEIKPVDVADASCALTYAWAEASTTPWSSTCAYNATRTVTWRCDRSDGVKGASETLCGAKPSPQVTQAVYESCESLILNPGFETSSAWTLRGGSYSTDFSHSGARSIFINGYGNSVGGNEIPVNIRSNYIVSFYAKGGQFGHPLASSSYVTTVLKGNCAGSLCSGGASWSLIEIKVNTALHNTIGIGFSGWNGSGAYIDDVSIRPAP